MDSASLAEKLDKLVTTHSTKELKGFVIYSRGDPQKLVQLAKDKNITQAAIAYLKEAKDTSGKNIFQLLKINPQAKSTILIYKDRKIFANFVDISSENFKFVEEAVTKMLQ